LVIDNSIANSRSPLRFSGSFVIFFTKNNYLGGRKSVLFIPKQGKAARRYGAF